MTHNHGSIKKSVGIYGIVAQESINDIWSGIVTTYICLETRISTIYVINM